VGQPGEMSFLRGGERTRVGGAQPLDNQLNSIRHGCDNR
jgi:hypothetical protein